MMKAVFNILAICGAAGFSGVMLSIGVTLGGYWRSLPSGDFLDWFAANNQFASKTIPLLVLPTLIGLIGSIWLSWGTAELKYWLASGLCVLVVAVLTFAYFVPSNTAFASGAMDGANVAVKLNQWLTIHNLRIGLAMAAAILGCVAIKV
ncbi:uncharacterized protein DUF1772 [Litoreibacter halocynthiae]|uniref:Uncharacterized protein DUF1772 n=1 Tax=Litoreibacter halocynthiae TaxID=1242689 RepID=A0A4R7LMH5_9RHOB|nr:DUF1772 domain-containing protein [Litoreibacter halocynthiae]TDT75651.1 uncharacterized protein DUF1772 [Litoreibacter halocynthiae]